MAHSRAVVGFWLMHAVGRPELHAKPMAELLGLVARGELRTLTGEAYPMSQAERAHQDLRARRTTGKLVLDPRG